MSLRSSVLVVALMAACGSDAKRSDEPQTAREKLRREARSDEADEGGGGKSWGKWRYQGARDACFYVVGAKCFETEAAACQAAACKPKRCVAEGAAPAQVRCD